MLDGKVLHKYDKSNLEFATVFIVELNRSTNTNENQNRELGIGVFNLLDQSHSDYLDRFRYFTNARRRNISFRLKIPFNINFKNHKP